MKFYKLLFLSILFGLLGCDESYIDDINAVDPGPDASAPAVTINYPNNATQIRVLEDVTTVNVDFKATDDIELVAITVAIDGTQFASFDAEDFVDYRSFATEAAYDNLTSGTHTVTVTATDASGKATTATVDFQKTEPYQPMDGEIFYMPFDGEITDLVTLTSGTKQSGATYSEGVNNSALTLDGTSSGYALYTPTDAITELESFTISYWVFAEFVDADANGQNDGALGMVNLSNTGTFWGNMDLFVENNSNPTDGADMRLHFTSTDISGGISETWITNVNDVQNFFGNWSHHVITFDAASGQFGYYINGVLMTTATAGWGANPVSFGNSGPIVFGTVQFQTNPSLTSATGSQPWAGYLKGKLDEVRIFNKALTETEVTNLHDSEKP